MPSHQEDDSNDRDIRKGMQAPHKSPFEGVLRDAVYDALRAQTRKRGVTAAQVYPKIRYLEFKRLALGKEGQPEAFSLSKLFMFADALNARPVVQRALCEAIA
jgi:hypothetical protein